MPLTYHSGQIEVQSEANTRSVAESLARWVGPVEEFATTADLILLATQEESGALAFTALSGKPPLVEILGAGALSLPMRILPDGEQYAGGLTISLERSQRARLNGWLTASADGAVLEAQEAFTNCRKYIAPSVAADEVRRVGPASRQPLELHDPWLRDLIKRGETSFFASINPAGQPDISHRGGPAGFLAFDPDASYLRWSEYVGDGMFKSAGNVRAEGVATFLIPDFTTGDAVELRGQASYKTLRTMKQARLDALQQHRDPYPVQGEMVLDVYEVLRLSSFVGPRQSLDRGLRITSSSTTDEQAPQ